MTSTPSEQVFTEAEADYLATPRLGRLVTLGPGGAPQVRPVGFAVSAGVIEIGGFDLAATQKFRNIGRDPRVAFIVDDLASLDPWHVRGVEVRGSAEAVPATGEADPVIRVLPKRVISRGLDDGKTTTARNIS